MHYIYLIMGDTQIRFSLVLVKNFLSITFVHEKYILKQTQKGHQGLRIATCTLLLALNQIIGLHATEFTWGHWKSVPHAMWHVSKVGKLPFFHKFSTFAIYVYYSITESLIEVASFYLVTIICGHKWTWIVKLRLCKEVLPKYQIHP